MSAGDTGKHVCEQCKINWTANAGRVCLPCLDDIAETRITIQVKKEAIPTHREEVRTVRDPMKWRGYGSYRTRRL